MVLFVHGGAWRTGDKQLAALLQKAGSAAEVLVVDDADAKSQREAHARIAQNLGNANHPMTRRIVAFVKGSAN